MLFCSAAKRNRKCVLNTAGCRKRDLRFLFLADLSQPYGYADVSIAVCWATFTFISKCPSYLKKKQQPPTHYIASLVVIVMILYS